VIGKIVNQSCTLHECNKICTSNISLTIIFRTNHPHRQVQIPSSRFAAAFEGIDRFGDFRSQYHLSQSASKTNY
jgi:hypothetical protein